MRFFDRFKDRYNVIGLILAIMFFILSFRLAILTIAKGEEYRHLADNKRLKEVYTTAPRGEIRDRYGRLLAGNMPSFTVQLLKDELNQYDTKEKNEAFLKLIRLLEEDGVSYVDEFPIKLNDLAYANEEDYIREYISPLDKVVNTIVENYLLGEILNTYYINNEYPEHFKYITANTAINTLRNKGLDVPISTKIEDSQLVFTFDEDTNIETWKNKNNISANATPHESLIALIDNDKAVIRNLADDSIGGKLILDILERHGLKDNLIIEDYAISYEKDYLNQKRALMKSHPEITMDSTAKEDFVNLFKKTSLKRFLEISVKDKNDNIIIPGKILIEMLEKKDIKVPLKAELGEDGSTVIYNYTGTKDIGDKSLVDLLVSYAEENSLLDDFITSEEIKSYAQSQLLNDGVNPRISIADDFEYMAISNLNDFYELYKIDKGSTGKEALESLRENYKLDKSLSKYEIRPIFILHYQLRKQGYLAYQPINVAYGIKDSTVAKIEESLMDTQGIYISVEPVRYYPEGSTLAHTLGYLGKISQPGEIKKYVEENGYSPNDIIGKTGVEESFEDKLGGTSGVKRVAVDSVGNSTNILDEVKPVPGDNLYLTIDLKLQQVAEESLEQTLNKLRQGATYESEWGNFKFGTNRSKGRPYIHAGSGAVVAIDVKTGQVLASASYPSYDPNLFSTGISSTDWESLFPEDENDPVAPRPLYNIATQTAMQPGSVFKMATALAALENGLPPTKTIRGMGQVDIGGQPFRCLLWTTSRRTHGPENVYDALRDSCNYYFYTLALGYNQKTGENLGTKISIEDITDLSKKLGLNDETGIEINVPREVSGGVPDPQKKILETKSLLKYYLNENIHNYYEDGFKPSNEDKEKIIEEIISWVEYEELLSRNEVIEKLIELKIDPEKTLAGERDGLADKIKFTYINHAGWDITDTLNVTIGQGRNAYTPIQMANYIATIANGGYKHKLTLVDSIKNYNNSKTSYSYKKDFERIELNNYENLEHIKKGMNLVSKDGIATASFGNFPVEVGVKTGTAERGGTNPTTGEGYDEFAWFVGFAPYDDPEIAIAAVLFQGGSGGHAGPLVRDIMAEYLGLNETDTEDNLPYENIISR